MREDLTLDAATSLRDAALRLIGTRQGAAAPDPEVVAAYELGRRGNIDVAMRALEHIMGPGQRAATGLKASLERYGAACYAYEAQLQNGLAAIADGVDVEEHYRALVALGKERGYAPALHFLGWLHRYVGEKELDLAVDYFNEAFRLGHRASGPHGARVQEMLAAGKARER